MSEANVCLWPFSDMTWDGDQDRFKPTSGQRLAGRAVPVYQFTRSPPWAVEGVVGSTPEPEHNEPRLPERGCCLT